jgi:hypothetical protein
MKTGIEMNIKTSFEFELQTEQLNFIEINKRLKNDGVALLTGILGEELLGQLEKEADQLLEEHGKRVNLLIQSTGNTPRKYVTVSRDKVFANAPAISTLYSSEVMLQLMEQVTQAKAITCPYEQEQIVVNKMSEPGDTHGWHWDDYTYSLVLVLEAPRSKSGAQVECVDGTQWDKRKARVKEYLESNSIQTLSLQSGSAYLLLGKRVMHRVSPMQENDSRKIICFTYATQEEQNIKIEHSSMEDIYG